MSICAELHCPNPVHARGKMCKVHSDRSSGAPPDQIEAAFQANLQAIKAQRTFTLEHLVSSSSLSQPEQGRAGRTAKLTRAVNHNAACTTRWSR